MRRTAMRVAFVERTNGPKRLVCEAEVVFGAEDGPLAGMKLVGFSLWRTSEGDMFVSLPARPFNVGGERRFFDLLRSVEADPADGRRVKAWILEQYRTSATAAA
jgi:hypothetical protein